MSEFDFQECAGYLANYLDLPGVVNICWTPQFGQLNPGKFFNTDIDDKDGLPGMAAALQYAQKLVNEGVKAVYMRETTMFRPPAWGRGTSADTYHTPWFWSDLDWGSIGHKGECLPPTEEAALRVLSLVETKLGPCSLLIHSGGGYYAKWKPHRVVHADEAERVSKNVQNCFAWASREVGNWDYGTGVYDLARVLRLPGTPNRKADPIRMCRVVGGTRRPVNIDIWPTFEEAPVKLKSGAIAPKLPPKKEYVPTGDKSPLDIFAEMVEWDELMEAIGFSAVGQDRTGYLYLRDGDADSKYSARVLFAQPNVLVVHSTSADLPVGKDQRLTKGRVYAYHCYGGDLSEATRELIRGENPLGLDQDVFDAIAAAMEAKKQVTVIRLPRGQHPTPDQFMAGVRVEWVDEHELVPDSVIDDFINTFTNYTRPAALQNRERWMREGGGGSMPRHVQSLINESVKGWYPGREAIRVILLGCRIFGLNPDVTVKTALGALLTSNASAS